MYSASSIELWETDNLAEHPFLRKLGPDVLDENLVWRDVLSRLQAIEFERRALASLYLDQGFLAGIGNYMRSEILFAASLAPRRKPCELSRGECGRLARATLEISHRAYTTAGLTNTPARIRALKKQGLKRHDYRFAVFDRDGQPCLVCGAEILKEILSRRVYFCPTCQSQE